MVFFEPRHRHALASIGVTLQVLLYVQRDEVEPDAIKQLVHLAESDLPVHCFCQLDDHTLRLDWIS